MYEAAVVMIEAVSSFTRVNFVVLLLKRIVRPAPAMKVAPVETLDPNKQKSRSAAVIVA